ncbi:sensor histidine kinase [Marinisporobacter balticus]|uniref:histidine kinase n=1 Tax=Marinisporobacter balticus TaxID=2018667 RepID=A0A4R2KUF6_9FIRM|nr:HAMP domain-containing sensor histidine kinase [Marinisporobacter balticus]TCO77443.1 signal transduction histidine kinase [Marinisporobacter balticus]
MKSILSKLWLGISALVVIILLMIWLFQVILLENFYIEERKDLLLEQGNKIASIVLSSADPTVISQEVVDEIDAFRSTFSFTINITIMDINNNPLFPTKNTRPPKDMVDLFKRFDINLNSREVETHMPFRKPPTLFDRSNIDLNSKEVETVIEQFGKSQRTVLVVKVPIQQDTHFIGNIILTSALAPIQETSSILKKQLSIITWISLFITALLAFLLAKLFTNPILKITEASKKISEGDFTAHVILDVNDEIGILGDTINHMAIQLGKTENFRREFIANISHELKTPISLIRAYAELVMDVDDLKEDRDQHLQVIIDESSRLNTMVEEILYLSKMEAGYLDLVWTKFPIIDLTKNIFRKFHFFASKKNIEFVLDMEDENTYIYADKDKLYQVFFNLMNNAIKHAYEFSTITIKVKPTNTSVRIAIIDHGQGIPKEDLPYIWDRFYKVDKSRKRDASGTGLGMSIVKNILENHHFSYGIDSEINKGTTVWFEFKKREA